MSAIIIVVIWLIRVIRQFHYASYDSSIVMSENFVTGLKLLFLRSSFDWISTIFCFTFMSLIDFLDLLNSRS
jgi:hypothetical protein